MKITIQTSSQAHLISKFLSAAGYDCDINTHVADMLILDWAHWSNQQKLAKTPTTLPILLLFDAADKADDHPSQCNQLSHFMSQGMHEYIVMPIRYPELLLRTQILLQRAYPDSTHSKPVDLIQFDQCDQYTFDMRTMDLMIHGQAIATPLTKKEFELALLFFKNINRPLSRAYIQEAIWGHETDLPSRTIDTHVSRVRNKLQCSLDNNPDLVTVYGYGYCLQQKSAKT